MKNFSQIMLALAVAGLGVVGIVSSNAGCGSSDSTGGAGSAGSGAGTTGSAGSGGGTTGSAGSGGGTTLRYVNDFATDKQNWALSTYVDSNYLNLGAATDPDSGVKLDGGAVPTLEWSSTDGDPAPGSLKISVNFTGFKQYVDPQVTLTAPVDLAGRILHVRVRLVSGTFPAGGVQFHASSGLTGANAYVYVSASFYNADNLTLGAWRDIPLDTETAANHDTPPRVWDPSQIVQFGVQFTTGDPYEGGTPAFGPAVFEIDTVGG